MIFRALLGAGWRVGQFSIIRILARIGDQIISNAIVYNNTPGLFITLIAMGLGATFNVLFAYPFERAGLTKKRGPTKLKSRGLGLYVQMRIACGTGATVMVMLLYFVSDVPFWKSQLITMFIFMLPNLWITEWFFTGSLYSFPKWVLRLWWGGRRNWRFRVWVK